MKLVDVAIFNFPNDASVLESILSAENIEYNLNNQDSAIIVPGSGTRLSVKEKDRERVIQIIKEAGFENNLLGYEGETEED
ncbi:MAG: hypothetical protein LIO93_05010 [Bacteroidales bacterium]|nr:hypothetical protein [Bacteroidales bacterium]